MHEPSDPNRNDVELPLLKALYRLGGSIRFSIRGRQIEDMLAEELNLTREQREYSDPSRYTAQGNRKWRNEIQFVRNQLADKGEIDRSQYDTWTISVQGYGRLGVEPRPDAPSAKKTASEAERHKKPAKSQLDKALELLRKLKPKE